MSKKQTTENPAKVTYKKNKENNSKKRTKKKRDDNLYSIDLNGLSIIPKEVINKAINIIEGRPTKYSKCMCKKVIQFMSIGLSKTQVANRLGITYDTFCNWCKREKENGELNSFFREDFFNAVKMGEQLSKDWWMLIGQLNLMNKDFNVGAYALQMANRWNWSRKDKVDIKAETINTEKKVLEVNLNYTLQETKEIIQGLIEDGVIESDDDTTEH